MQCHGCNAHIHEDSAATVARDRIEGDMDRIQCQIPVRVYSSSAGANPTGDCEATNCRSFSISDNKSTGLLVSVNRQ
jgi:hypothetical protein